MAVGGGTGAPGAGGVPPVGGVGGTGGVPGVGTTPVGAGAPGAGAFSGARLHETVGVRTKNKRKITKPGLKNRITASHEINQQHPSPTHERRDGKSSVWVRQV